MQRPPAINCHAAPKSMLVHSRTLIQVVMIVTMIVIQVVMIVMVSGCLIWQRVVHVAPVAGAPAGFT